MSYQVDLQNPYSGPQNLCALPWVWTKASCDGWRCAPQTGKTFCENGLPVEKFPVHSFQHLEIVGILDNVMEFLVWRNLVRYFNSIRKSKRVSFEKVKIQRKSFQILNEVVYSKENIFFCLFEEGIVNFGICFEFLRTLGFVPMLNLQLSWLKWMKLKPSSKYRKVP